MIYWKQGRNNIQTTRKKSAYKGRLTNAIVYPHRKRCPLDYRVLTTVETRKQSAGKVANTRRDLEIKSYKCDDIHT